MVPLPTYKVIKSSSAYFNKVFSPTYQWYLSKLDRRLIFIQSFRCLFPSLRRFFPSLWGFLSITQLFFRHCGKLIEFKTPGQNVNVPHLTGISLTTLYSTNFSKYLYLITTKSTVIHNRASLLLNVVSFYARKSDIGMYSPLVQFLAPLRILL